MNYYVKRGTDKLGPFTLAELSQRVASGDFLPIDEAQSEGMSDWVAISQVLGNIPVLAASVSGAAAAPAFAPQRELAPLPANLHWGILLLLDAVTRGLFNLIWALYLANWARKLDGQNKHLVLVAMYPAGVLAGGVAMASKNEAVGGILIFGGLIAYLIGIFSIKAAMEEYYTTVENYGLSLSGAMTFFFSTVYLQFHINQLARQKKSAAISIVG